MKLMVVKLKELSVEWVLIVVVEVSENVYFVLCNLLKVEVCDVYVVDFVSLIVYDKVIIIVDVFKKIEE